MAGLTSARPTGPVSWVEAARRVYGVQETTKREQRVELRRKAAQLKRYVASRVAAGRPDPRSRTVRGSRIVMGELYRCLPELQPARSRDAAELIRDLEERLERLQRDVARAESEASMRAHLRRFHAGDLDRAS